LYLQEGKWILPTGEEGILFIGFSTAYLVKAERDTLINLVSIVAMVLVISIALAYYMAGQLTRPLEQLKATTQRIMANELTERAATDSGSMEMRTVADAFNQMIEKLLTSQRERLAEMELFNQSLGERNQVIEEINRKLIDSIEYAQLIQNALFPEPSTLDQSYMKVAPLFWPKDIVSGDFYWARQYKGVWYIAVVDCTGHGVPGAFMTLIGGNFLEQTLEKSESGNLSEMLENMNARVRDFLKQHTNEYVTQDGMDMGLLRLDPLAKTLHFAGARRPLYVIRQDGQFEEHKAVRRSIGGKTRAGERDPYLSEAIPYEPGMRLFLSTDGFADQFNTAGQKFGSKRLKQFLQDSANQPLEYQIENLEALLFAHRGSEEQTDDITLVGVELL
jgi:serine phosphatase RsbU (regulator of sigma subunit)